MSGIVTLTLAPCIEKHSTINRMEGGHVCHCSTASYNAGGGGIKIARTLRLLGTPSRAVYLAGGSDALLLSSMLQAEHVTGHAIQQRNATQQRQVLYAHASHQQFVLAPPVPMIYPDEYAQLLHYLETLAGMKWLVLSGDQPAGFPDEGWVQLSELAERKQARLVLQVNGYALKEALHAGSFLVQTDYSSFCEFARVQSLSIKETTAISRAMIFAGMAQWIIVTMGLQGMLLVGAHMSLFLPPAIVAQGTVTGKSYSLLAGLLHALDRGTDVPHAVRFGVQCAAADALHPYSSLLSKTQLSKLRGPHGLLI